MKRSYSAIDIRKRNHRTVFELIRQKEEILRPEITSYTGLTPPTVMKVAQSFLERGILKNAGEADTLLGRKPMKLAFNPNAAYAVGVLFEGGEIRAGLVNLAGEIVQSVKLSIDYTFSPETQNAIISLVEKLAKDVKAPVLGVGLGLPGVVDTRKQIIEFAPLIGIVNPMNCTEFCQEVRDRTGFYVHMENDVNAAAVGEFSFRKFRKNEDLLYISIGTGVGAGIIINGSLRRGARNLAGELGYTVKSTDYHVCRSCPGWLESQIGQESLKKRFNWPGYEKCEEIPSGLMAYVVENLAPPVANLATHLDIMTIIIGGMAADMLGDKLLEPLKDKINALSLEPAHVSLPVCADSGVTGAAMLVINNNLDEWLISDEE